MSGILGTLDSCYCRFFGVRGSGGVVMSAHITRSGILKAMSYQTDVKSIFDMAEREKYR